jgi:hypothetical protein
LLLHAAPAASQQAAAGEALALAREGRLDSALVLLSRARAADPDDADLQLAHARVLGWAGRRRQSIAVYDSLLARDPRNVDAMVGLGYVYHWERRERAAKRQADAAIARDSTNADALALRRAIHTAARPSLESSANWSNDSDHNTNFWQTHSLSVPITGGLDLLAAGSLLQASDPVRDAWRYGGEAGLAWAGVRVEARALAGARRLDPDVGKSRTAATYRGSLRWRPAQALGIGAGYARYPFDEIASLIERNLNIESLEGDLDIHPTSELTLTSGGGALWLNDGNRRTEGRATISQQVGEHVTIGAAARAFGYRERGDGYFSPDRFHLLEGTAALSTGDGTWDGTLSGGLGGQQIGRSGDTQTEWHVEARAGVNWGDGNRLEGFGGVTNNAASSTTGAFRYRTAGLLLTLGL